MCGWWWVVWRGGAKVRVRWDGMGWEGVEGSVGGLVEGEEEDGGGGGWWYWIGTGSGK